MKITSLVLALPVIWCASIAMADAPSENRWQLDFRYRAEFVDQDGLSEDALGSTLRTRLSYTLPLTDGFDAGVELDNVSYLGSDQFNSTRNGLTAYPVIADPRGTAFNQAWFRYRHTAGEVNWHAQLGRQRINLTNQRFVGGVAWRQNEQTFDAFVLSHARKKWQLSYRYLSEVDRIFGPDGGMPDDELDTDSHLFNLDVTFSKHSRMAVYHYDLDFDDARDLSNRTSGFRYTSSYQLGDVSLPMAFEIARQTDTGTAPVQYTAHYLLAEVGFKTRGFTTTLGYEQLEADNRAFQTPLATLHKFQGWADKFLTTPATGVEDTYLAFDWRQPGRRLQLIWHSFNAETGGGKLGSELNASLHLNVTEQLSLLIKAADYRADNHATDTTKVWVTFSVKL